MKLHQSGESLSTIPANSAPESKVEEPISGNHQEKKNNHDEEPPRFISFHSEVRVLGCCSLDYVSI